jgi:hypothetical protein
MCRVRMGTRPVMTLGWNRMGGFCGSEVKSTTFCRKGSYTSNITGPKHERYARGKVDFFAVYLVPVDVWYIIPFDVVEGNLSLNLTPRKGHKFAQYYGRVEFAAGGGEEEESGSGSGVGWVTGWSRGAAAHPNFAKSAKLEWGTLGTHFSRGRIFLAFTEGWRGRRRLVHQVSSRGYRDR